MTEAVWRDRLVESIQHAFDACWYVPPATRRGSASFELLSAEEERREAESRFVALADLVMPFAAAGILDERAPVGDLPAPAEIRKGVRDAALTDRFMSVGCELARVEPLDNPELREELEREWSTWLTFCMYAHSRELRRALPLLPEALVAIHDLQPPPRRRVEEIAPEGEQLPAPEPEQVGARGETSGAESPLAQCEVVAAHADSLRILGPLFPELIASVWVSSPYQSAEFNSGIPFVAYLWPFSSESFRTVAGICDAIQRLAESLKGDDGEGDEDRETQVGVYVPS